MPQEQEARPLARQSEDVGVKPPIKGPELCQEVESLLSRSLRWETNPSNHIFFFNGRIMCGSHAGQLSLSLFLMTGTYAAFACFVLPFLLHPMFSLVLAITFVLNVTLILWAATTEPGVLPRAASHPVVSRLAGEIAAKDYCNICNIIRPPRSRHCRYCDCCVSCFDHHCPWIGNCIGERNYVPFFLFLTTIHMTSLLALGVTIYVIVNWFLQSGLNLTFPFAYVFWVRVVALGIFSLWFATLAVLTGSLWCFHIFLIRKKKTTCEYLRQTKVEEGASTISCCICYAPATRLLPMWLPEDEDDHNAEIQRLEETYTFLQTLNKARNGGNGGGGGGNSASGGASGGMV